MISFIQSFKPTFPQCVKVNQLYSHSFCINVGRVVKAGSHVCDKTPPGLLYLSV